MYTRRDIAVLWYAAGLLTGLLVAFASCSATPDVEPQRITTGEQR
jgi:hypothetical protein